MQNLTFFCCRRSISFPGDLSAILVALAAALSCVLFSIFLIFRKSKLQTSSSEMEKLIPRCENGGGEKMTARVEKLTGASMMEQLVPEITMHALSYLDYSSLCRLSMTNSLMRKVANDDNAWKALYHKDFSLEQDSLLPPNGWKYYYAATRAIVNVNNEFFRILRERSLPAMAQLWLNANYVKCFHGNRESFSGYNAVMTSWQLAFGWENVARYQEIQDVRTRVVSGMAWVTMKAYVDVNRSPDNVTNVYEFHNGRWYMVHHHSSPIMVVGLYGP